MMKILQANLHRNRIADSLLSQLRIDLKVDVAILSEQYRNKDGPGWYPDLLNTAAIWIPDTRTPIKAYGAERGFVWVKWEGVTVVACYFTPNENISDFRAKLDHLEDTVRDIESEVVVAGDFNAKAIEWGMPTTDSRGRQILEMASRLGLNVINEGSISTFRRPGYGETIPDVTFASESLSSRITNWRVIEEYTGSDHQYIVYDLQRAQRANNVNPRRAPRWKVSQLNEEVFTTMLEEGKADILEMTGDEIKSRSDDTAYPSSLRRFDASIQLLTWK